VVLDRKLKEPLKKSHADILADSESFFAATRHLRKIGMPTATL
jgi:hypothetical protein